MALVGAEGVRQIVAIALMQPVLSLGGGLFAHLPSATWPDALHSAMAGADHAGWHGHGGDTLSAQLLGLLIATLDPDTTANTRLLARMRTHTLID